jgi:hypothetical protein
MEIKLFHEWQEKSFIEKNPSYYENEWAKALNKQGYLSCCQMLSAMKAYVNLNLDALSEEEQNWFCRYSWWFLTALQEKLVICEDCLEFYGKLRTKVKKFKIKL